MNKVRKSLVIRWMELRLQREAQFLANEAVLNEEFHKGRYDAVLRKFVGNALRKFQVSIRKSATSIRKEMKP